MSDAPARSADGDVVELRVHGVSGARAETVLDRPNLTQVAGDRNGGFFRPRPGYPDTRGPGGVILEAYRWSDLPSGTAMRTLSLVFLLPFMLCNVALWMRPGSAGRWELVVKALCRLLALLLTALYVLSVAGVALDLIAWKCLASARCVAGRSWLSWLGGQPVGLRLAVLALVPVAAVGLVWWLGARSAQTFEAFRAPPVSTASVHKLAAVGQWDAAPVVDRLRAIHVAAALATLDAVLLTARLGGGPSTGAVVLAGLVGAVLATCAALVCWHPAIDPPGMGRVDRLTRILRTFTGALTAVVLVAVAADPTPWRLSAELPGYAVTVAGMFAAQTLLLAVLWAVVVWSRTDSGDGRPLRALGAPVLGAVATGLAVAFSAELVYRSADLLDRNQPPPESFAAGPPLAYKWAIFGFFLAVVGAAALAAATGAVTRRGRCRAAEAIAARDFPDAPPAAEPRLRHVRRVIARARFTERLAPLAITYAWLAGFGMATSAVGVLGLEPGGLIERLTGVPGGLVHFGIEMGSYVIIGVLLGLVIGGLFAYRTAEFRRYVGVLWDLGTFWPRIAHPFAPPCYAERAVPELARRIAYLTGQGQSVLLAGHSHGSVLLAATVLQLEPRACDRVALLTYGSPLHRLYAHWFPAYVNAPVLAETGERVGWRWVNLWRDTDPIGGWIFSPHRPGEPPAVAGPAGGVDRRMRDPWDVVIPPDDSVPPPILGHWPAESDPRFADAVRELADRLRRSAGPGGLSCSR